MKIIYSVLTIVIIFTALVAASRAAPYHRDISDHFDGTRFFHGERDYTFLEMLKWIWTMNPAKWPEWIEDPAYPPPPERVGKGELRITHINHATTLIQVDGANILTDPIWAERASVTSWAGPKRVRAPGVKMQDLPPIDMILISHNHYDHLDIASLRQLTKNHSPKIIVGLGVGELLRSEGFENIVEMDWWQEYASLPGNLKVVFVPARHNSGRGLFDKNKTLWGGFVVESSAGYIYFAGDTAYGKFLDDIKNKFGGFRVALLPIGHYEPRWMMETHHMNPDDAVKLHKYLNIKQSIGMHFGTFGGHNDEEVDAHEKDLQAALKKYQVPNSEFMTLGFGEGRDFPRESVSNE
jgi:L-ascorbate metabolism protein UlaG (beta-lactamase superfamily)